MQNAGLDEPQTGIKISRRNTNNLRYVDDTTQMAKSEKELKSFCWRWKRRVKKAGLQLNIKKLKITASGPITSWQTEEEKVEADRFYFLGFQNNYGWWPYPWNQKMLAPWKESYAKPR